MESEDHIPDKEDIDQLDQAFHKGEEQPKEPEVEHQHASDSTTEEVKSATPPSPAEEQEEEEKKELPSSVTSAHVEEDAHD